MLLVQLSLQILLGGILLVLLHHVLVAVRRPMLEAEEIGAGDGFCADVRVLQALLRVDNDHFWRLLAALFRGCGGGPLLGLRLVVLGD